ncbi:MAG: 2-oxoacid:acceptor oxidoreductase subunit alpha [Candidatus Kariarchaeaceae archaeon]
MNEVIVRIAAAAGDGVASMGELFAKMCTRNGLYVHGLNYYQSIIRGGVTAWNVRIANKPVYTQGDKIDILIALRTEAIEAFAHEVKEGGLILINENVKMDKEIVEVITLPLIKNVKEIAPRLKVLQNTIVLGTLIKIMGFKLEKLEEMLTEIFGSKGERVVEMNHNAARRGYELGEELRPVEHSLKFNETKRILISGNQATAVGAIAGGLQYHAQYPMTPTTGILHFLAAHAVKYNMVVKQMEDEIGVVNSVIGAAYGGARAMCATAGGGFALMTEGLGLAAMLELPITVITGMRGGPSTGLPTLTEQGDLNQVYGASQGDYPRVIIAFSDIVDSYETVIEGLNLAEKYQLVILLITDTYLAEHHETLEEGEMNLEVENYSREKPKMENGEYKRYKVTESGVSPRSIPGEEGFEHVAGSDEHDEWGHLISDRRAGLPESLKIRNEQVEKRARKAINASKEFKPVETYGTEDGEITIVGWGSTKKHIQEAIDQLAGKGIKANSLHIRYIQPFQKEEVSKLLNQAKKTLIVEQNYSGQMKRHILAETGIEINYELLKYDGSYLKTKEIVEKVKEVMK